MLYLYVLTKCVTLAFLVATLIIFTIVDLHYFYNIIKIMLKDVYYATK